MKFRIMKLLTICCFVVLLFSFAACDSQNSLPEGENKAHADGNIIMSEQLKSALAAYLENSVVCHDMPETSFSIKLDEIKGGKHALLVKFNSSDYYYAVAYCSEKHENEKTVFCCVSEYVWVGFEKASDITEYYKDKKIVAAFQINKTTVCENILTQDKSVTESGHYTLFKTEIKDGYNVAPAVDVEGSFIYIADSDKKALYCGTSDYNFYWRTIECADISGNSYFAINLRTEYPDGRIRETDLSYEFGSYYIELQKVMITDEYSKTDEQGVKTCYGLFEKEDIADILGK